MLESPSLEGWTDGDEVLMTWGRDRGGGTFGLDDLEGLFQPKRFYDSISLTHTALVLS